MSDILAGSISSNTGEMAGPVTSGTGEMSGSLSSSTGEMTGTISNGSSVVGTVSASDISGMIESDRSLRGSVDRYSGVEYSSIRNRPYIEGQELKSGDNDYEEIGLNRLTNSEIEEIFTR